MPCSIDLHNFARWEGEIVGQKGPPASALAGTWFQIAKHYAAEDRVIFGTMGDYVPFQKHSIDSR